MTGIQSIQSTNTNPRCASWECYARHSGLKHACLSQFQSDLSCCLFLHGGFIDCNSIKLTVYSFRILHNPHSFSMVPSLTPLHFQFSERLIVSKALVPFGDCLIPSVCSMHEWGHLVFVTSSGFIQHDSQKWHSSRIKPKTFVFPHSWIACHCLYTLKFPYTHTIADPLHGFQVKRFLWRRLLPVIHFEGQ